MCATVGRATTVAHTGGYLFLKMEASREPVARFWGPIPWHRGTFLVRFQKFRDSEQVASRVSYGWSRGCTRFLQARCLTGTSYWGVYLVRLISIWYCNWFMLFMTLDMPDEGTR